MRLFLLAAVALMLTGCYSLEPNVRNVDFGEVYIGTSVTSADINWTNADKNPIEVVGVTPSFQPGGEFALQPLNYVGRKLKTNQACSPVQVVFAPRTIASFKASLEPFFLAVPGTSANARPVGISGSGVAQIQTGSIGVGGAGFVVGSAMDFGSVSVSAAQGKSMRIDVVNTSSAPISVNYRFVTGGQGFAVDSPTAPFTIAANGGKVTVKIRFTPQHVGAAWDAIEFFDVADPAANKAGTSLTGTGTE